MDIVISLEALAMQNIYGISFLFAYGLTWIVSGLVWLKAKPRTAALCTLFQGMVAFPIAITLSFAFGALGQERVVDESITQLSILIGLSQLLGLPLLVYLFVQKQFAIMPYAFATICSMHFMLYSWLYQTPFYIAMAAFIAIGTTVLMLVNNRAVLRKKSSLVSLLTGGSMLATVLVFLFIFFNVTP